MAFPKHIGISKSRYTLYRQCPKALWLKTYKPELCIISDALQQRFQAGSVVGDLAKGLFGKFVDVTSYSDNETLNLSKMIADTRKFIDSRTEVICEAAFKYEDGYCAVDILNYVPHNSLIEIMEPYGGDEPMFHFVSSYDYPRGNIHAVISAQDITKE